MSSKKVVPASERAMTITDKKHIRRQELREKKLERKCNSSYASRANIRNIVSGIRRKKVVPNVSEKMYDGDMTEMPDLMTVMNAIEKGKSLFMNMPSKTREFFGNDPVKYFQFIQKREKTPAEMQMGVELGILKIRKPEKKPDPQRVVVVEKDDKKKATKEPAAQ